MRMRIAGGLLLVLACAAAPVFAQMADRAEAIVSNKCFICHGLLGESSSRQYPKLAAQHAQYIAKQLDDFKTGRRKSDTMRAMASELTAEEMVALGQYFEKQASPAVPHADSAIAEAGRSLFLHGNPARNVPACASCHGEKGHGTPLLPRLAGQRPAYLENQLRLFTQRERTNDNAVMHDIAANLKDDDVVALAIFLGSAD